MPFESSEGNDLSANWPGFTEAHCAAGTSSTPQLTSLRTRAPGSLALSEGLGSYPFLLTGIACSPGNPAGLFTVNGHQGNVHTPRLSALVDCT